MAEAGRNPNRIIPWVLRAFVDEHRPRRVRIIGEPIFVGRTPEEIGPCVQHEALINVAFAGVDAMILCPYDVARLSHIVSAAEHTHPVIVERDGRRRPGDYLDPAVVVDMHNTPLPEPTTVDDAFVFDLPRLGELRRIVGHHAVGAGLSAERVADAQVAVTEIATNALTHGGPTIATLRAWSDPGRVVYEIRGAGQIADPMAGRVVPPPDTPHGRGLLVANRLCDLVQTHTDADRYGHPAAPAPAPDRAALSAGRVNLRRGSRVFIAPGLRLRLMEAPMKLRLVPAHWLCCSLCQRSSWSPAARCPAETGGPPPAAPPGTSTSGGVDAGRAPVPSRPRPRRNRPATASSTG